MPDEEVIGTQETSVKKSREKSVRYPAYSLKQCLDFLSTVHSIGGKKEAPVESILSKLNLTSADTKSYKYLVSSSEIFGLVEKMENGIKPTNIGTLILFPPNGEEERKKLLIETFKSPAFYQKVIERYDKMVLPTNNILKNVFLHLGIATNALDNAVEAFIESAQYVNVLDSENRLSLDFVSSTMPSALLKLQDSDDVNGGIKSKSDQVNSELSFKEKKRINSEYNTLDILMSNGKMASLIIPIDANNEDINKLIKLLEVFRKE